MDKKEKNQPLKLSRSARVLLVTLVTMVVYLLALVTPYVYPFARFPAYVVSCGKLPVIADKFAASYSYRIPGDNGYVVTPLTSEYFCSEDEAIRAGFHRF